MATETGRPLWAAIAASAVVIGLGSVGCGLASNPPAGSPRPTAERATSAQALSEVEGASAGALSRTAMVSLRLTGATIFGGGGTAVSGRGPFDFGALRGRLSLTAGSGAAAEPVVFAPTAVYVQPPVRAGLLPAGKVWTVADFTDPEALNSSFPRLIAQAESLNPALAIDEVLWGGTAAAARDDGSYKVTVDLHRALANSSGAAQVPFGRAIATEAVAASTLTIQVRTTANGQLTGLALTPPGVGVGRVSMTLSNIGARVIANPPPASQVVDVLALSPAGERENRNGGDSDGG